MPALTTYQALFTNTVSGTSTNTITYSSIPATYTDLEISILGRGLTASNYADVIVQFNGDSGSNYSRTRIYGNGSSTASDRQLSSGSWGLGLIPAASNAANAAGDIRIMINSYARTTSWKSMLAVTGSESNNGIGFTEVNVGSWRSTAAINSISIFSTPGNFAAGTVVTIWGITAA